MEVLGVIPARFASTRFEGKVLADILGKPMIQWVYEAASKVKLLDDLIIACDDERIKKEAERFGAKAILTSRDHASGTDRIAEVVNPIDTKIIVNIQADEPLIDPSMIDSVARTLLDNETVPMSSLRKKITDPHELYNPDIVKVVVDKDEFALYFSRSPIPSPKREIDKYNPVLPVGFFKHIGIYGYTKDFLFTFKNLPVSTAERIEKLEQLRALENGYKIKVLATEIETIGVDTPEDLACVKNRLSNKR
ncbi:MAG TPA: 3-deoxy-manno-octulosonate cytidylyltransferase [Candidatus Omnitrophica bacterium]|nr:3-deoxy-manno-octulosonate cytidylyltransferase [Candidatus Omnitrophota bacterium]